MSQTEFEKVVTIKLKEYNQMLDELTTLREFKNNREIWCLRKIDNSFGPVGYSLSRDQTFLKDGNKTIDELKNRLDKFNEKYVVLEFRLNKIPKWLRTLFYSKTAHESNK